LMLAFISLLLLGAAVAQPLVKVDFYSESL